MTPDCVRLQGYPVALGTAGAEHMAEWVREFRLMAFAADADERPAEVPERLTAMFHHLNSEHAADLAGPDRLRDEAAARGEAVIELVYPVRPDTEATVRAWQTVLHEVDAWCRAQGLLTLERSPDLVALSDWVLEEFLRQLRGEPPRPWRPRIALAE